MAEPWINYWYIGKDGELIKTERFPKGLVYLFTKQQIDLLQEYLSILFTVHIPGKPESLMPYVMRTELLKGERLSEKC